jgi:hypothetical protein
MAYGQASPAVPTTRLAAAAPPPTIRPAAGRACRERYTLNPKKTQNPKPTTTACDQTCGWARRERGPAAGRRGGRRPRWQRRAGGWGGLLAARPRRQRWHRARRAGPGGRGSRLWLQHTRTCTCDSTHTHTRTHKRDAAAARMPQKQELLSSNPACHLENAGVAPRSTPF